VEEVSDFRRSLRGLVWREVLSQEEIKLWVSDYKKPTSVIQKTLAHPGVYRFIFPEQVDGTAKHTPFYVGEAGNIGKRLCYHFGPPKKRDEQLDFSNIVLKPGWQVRGAIQNSDGDLSVQILCIEGSVEFCGLILGQSCFDSLHARRLLENWAILYSDHIEKLHPLNLGLTETGKAFWRMRQLSQTKKDLQRNATQK
jgi:hypothetical protein